MTHIRVDQQGLLAQLRKHDCKVGCGIAAAISSRHADDSQALAIEVLPKPAYQQLTAQGAKRLDLSAEWTVCSNDFGQYRALSRHDIRVTELQGDYAFDLIACDQSQLQRRVAKTQSFFLRIAKHALGVL